MHESTLTEVGTHGQKLLGLRDGVLVPYRESESWPSTRALRLRVQNQCLTGMLNGAKSTMYVLEIYLDLT